MAETRKEAAVRYDAARHRQLNGRCADEPAVHMDHSAATLSNWAVPSVILPGNVSLCYPSGMLEDDIPLSRAIGRSVGEPEAKVLGWTPSTFGDGFADALAGGEGLILHTGTAMTADGERQYQIVEKVCRVLPSGLTGAEPDPFIDNLSEIHRHFLALGEEAMELAGA